MSEITPKCSQKRPVFGFLSPVQGGIPNAVQQGTMVNDLHEFLLRQDGWLICAFCAQEAPASGWRNLFELAQKAAEEEQKAAKARASLSIVHGSLRGNGPSPA